jgi:hypothetical protein
METSVASEARGEAIITRTEELWAELQEIQGKEMHRLKRQLETRKGDDEFACTKRQ